MKTYPKMKDSGIEWIKDIPEKWDVKRLKFTTRFDLSTVNRHEYDDEIRVSICHYPQVYNNEKISLETKLPQGTCSQKELEKFRLKKDDVLITKDSETPDDIGVPVYIQDNFEDTVCGYHIAQLSTDKNQILGSFLFRFLQSDIANSYFETEANGITRFGLGKDSINNLRIVFPSIEEQKLISEFIKKQISIITNKISKNNKLSLILKEKKQAMIHHAITKGLDPSVPMKDSGINWIGDIPENWSVIRLKFINSTIIAGQSPSSTSYSEKEGIPFIQGCEGFTELYPSPKILTTEPTKIVDNNTILVSVRAPVGKLNLANSMLCIGRGVIGIKCEVKFTDFKFLYYFFKAGINELKSHSSGTTYDAIRIDNLENFITLKIPYSEQLQISQFLDNQTSKIDSVILKNKLQISKLQEFRQSIISSVITGKIDVRDIVA